MTGFFLSIVVGVESMLLVALRVEMNHDGNEMGRITTADWWVGTVQICLWLLLNSFMMCKTQCLRKNVPEKETAGTIRESKKITAIENPVHTDAWSE